MKTVSASNGLTRSKIEETPRMKEKVHLVVVYIVLVFILGSVTLFYLIFGGILAAYRIGDLCQTSWLGYPVILLGYALIGMAVWRTRKIFLRLPFIGAMIHSFRNEFSF